MVYTDVVIVGGGISGLYILNRIVQQFPKLSVRLLETKPDIGGQISTLYNKDGSVRYETGPWRFHHKHIRIKALLDQFGLHYHQNTSSRASKQIIEFCKPTSVKTRRNKSLQAVPGLSYRDVTLSRTNCKTSPGEFDKLPLRMDSTSRPYDVNMSYNGAYFVVDKGFSELAKRLTIGAKKHITSNCRVLNISKSNNGYNLQTSTRTRQQFKQETIQAKYVFLCVPPRAAECWSVAQHMRPMLASVETLPLHHIYAKVETGKKKCTKRPFYYRTNSPLGHIISGDYDPNWFQISYTSGEDAKYWARLRQNDETLFRNRLLTLFKKTTSKVGIDIAKIGALKSHYWEHAIHIWKPVYGFSSYRNMQNSVYPHPVMLPNLFFASEAYSTIQGWIEGALETAELAFDIFNATITNRYIFHPVRIIKKDYINLDGRIVHIKKWQYRHPGSQKAIENHIDDKDAIEIFRHINHSANAWATTYSLQRYWEYNGIVGKFER